MMSVRADGSRKALVCDDEAVTSARLAQHLEELGYEVAARPANGVDAVQAAQLHQPDVILMDIKMPGMDGLEAACLIRQAQPAATIVLITAYVTDGFIDQAVQAGVEGYLIKPVSLEQLRVALILALETSRRIREAQYDAATARKQLADRKVIERAKGILMETQGISETDAYRSLQKRSQDERRAMVDLAEEIIRAHGLLTGRGQADEAAPPSG
jgi:AmiR/NasT family two-component response regulator